MRSRPAFTIVEMLVATTVTLLLILALAQAFAVVSETVITNRAMLELAAQLHSASTRLQRDLDGVPTPVITFRPSGAGLGYLEYGEGTGYDLQNVALNSAFGDVDDYLMFTSESVDMPFSGRYCPAPRAATINSTILHSRQAEIAWWILGVASDANGDGKLGVGEIKSNLYRRSLLIRPDLNYRTDALVSGYFISLPQDDPAMPANSSGYDPGNQGHLKNLFDYLAAVNNELDISYHVIRIESNNRVQLRLVANSMSDLSLRQNRFAHDPVVVSNNGSPPTYTYIPLPAAGARQPPYEFVTGFDYLYLQRHIKTGDRIGEDIYLTNVMAFDVRAYDPLAALSASPGEDGEWGLKGSDDDSNGTGNDASEACWVGTDDEVIGPGDRGYGLATVPVGSGKQILRVGNGAFVDLNYFVKVNDFLTKLSQPTLTTSEIPVSNFRMAGGIAAGASANASVYDTWALDYENNGFDDDSDNPASVDEATNGIDDDGLYGADDAGERETSPPYAVDLRALQIRIRIQEPDTRQVRQTTVVADFTSE